MCALGRAWKEVSMCGFSWGQVKGVSTFIQFSFFIQNFELRGIFSKVATSRSQTLSKSKAHT